MALQITTPATGRMQGVLDGELSIQTIEGVKDDLFGLLNAADVALDLTKITE